MAVQPESGRVVPRSSAPSGRWPVSKERVNGSITGPDPGRRARRAGGTVGRSPPRSASRYARTDPRPLSVQEVGPTCAGGLFGPWPGLLEESEVRRVGRWAVPRRPPGRTCRHRPVGAGSFVGSGRREHRTAGRTAKESAPSQPTFPALARRPSASCSTDGPRSGIDRLVSGTWGPGSSPLAWSHVGPAPSDVCAFVRVPRNGPSAIPPPRKSRAGPQLVDSRAANNRAGVAREGKTSSCPPAIRLPTVATPEFHAAHSSPSTRPANMVSGAAEPVDPGSTSSTGDPLPRSTTLGRNLGPQPVDHKQEAATADPAGQQQPRCTWVANSW
jgi:hypothetical protein